jgi:hypothetical protein
MINIVIYFNNGFFNLLLNQIDTFLLDITTPKGRAEAAGRQDGLD